MKKHIFYLATLLLSIISCKQEPKKPVVTINIDCKSDYYYGYNLDLYNVNHDTIKYGDTFGAILDRYHVPFSRINEIVTSVRDTFDVRKMRPNKSFTILTSKDTTNKAKVFIYKHNNIVSKIIDFNDSIPNARIDKLPIKITERTVSGVIMDNFSKSLDTIGVSPTLSYRIADIYASTIDFYRLQKGDTFKIIFDEKFIKDSISVGYGKIKAMVFKHRSKDLYAYGYTVDSITKSWGYYDENGSVMERQFLKSPIKFQYRISSRYNLTRRIAHYGNKVRPHLGTDFAAPKGTPIMSTANGVVVESARRGGNGNYVKIKHDKTYSTQYLHMKRRKVKVGDYVIQGDVIGWVGMTGSTSGPHVCYRFWKNKRQVDPLRLLLPPSKPMKKELKPKFLEYTKPYKKILDETAVVK